MLRNVGAVLAGLIVGSILNMALIFANMAVFPPPDGADLNDPTQLAAFLASAPPTVYILPILAHLTQALVGGALAARLGAAQPVTLASIVGGLTALGTLINLVLLSPPLWTWGELLLYPPVIRVASVWAARQRGAPA